MANDDDSADTRLIQDPEDPPQVPTTACLVMLNCEDIGNSYSLDRAELLAGRSRAAQIHIRDDTVSRLHAKFLVTPGSTLLRDLGSSNGTFINNGRISEAEVSDGDIVRFGRVLLKYLSGTNVEQKYHEQIFRLTTTDPLTNTFNRRYFLDFLERELMSSQSYARLLTLVIFDVDNFKQVNDKYGHAVGDYVLQEVASLVTRNLRKGDVLARYGGDEFSIVLPELHGDQAYTMCEKLRRQIAGKRFRSGNKILSVTISLGLRSIEPTETGLDVSRIIADADANLLEAKRTGRNRTAY